ncbi:HAD-superfamily class IIA hydrolase, TIGR01459 [Meinhardsimonia xiamenensis]|jgi:HAD superfamily hydrolase (TIGR01459 family)|uniref:HAD-superfamily class IIA hydrolase, TIGR01459 n=1 Tax=Meinhardsimonia xiamenensis TaxID=990712 RepID=A0A1G8ZAI2_9RHOB|nr:TIGR01459 family HAD-type hydrolase [Meinhardsimonia xiamenensis]PRX37591.1 HAD superfamily hydrolase (TIGR01459 family) [Meinhardsimonia xiamenensis]SDK11170.1 HAD-superfamily class IIA hydrolase, TIGR01459 [Meinhardsimonia xiamenensis]
MTEIVHALADISAPYEALFCDLWGCVHDGLRAFPQAVAALEAFRRNGGAVVLLTNAPRPRAEVERQIAGFGVPDSAWDVVVTSGDAARVALYSGAVGRRVFHIGEPRDLSFFQPPRTMRNPIEIERVPLEQAEGIVCTGPFDPHADPATLRPQLLYAREKGLKLLCANPDIVVDRGDSREWCAGAVARLYEEMGGEVLYFGKPHPPIYELARQRLAEIGREPALARTLAIGDGIETDVRGAFGEDIDALFITGGLAAAETGTPPGGDPDPKKLAAFLARHQLAPRFAMGFLR